LLSALLNWQVYYFCPKSQKRLNYINNIFNWRRLTSSHHQVIISLTLHDDLENSIMILLFQFKRITSGERKLNLPQTATSFHFFSNAYDSDLKYCYYYTWNCTHQHLHQRQKFRPLRSAKQSNVVISIPTH